MIATAYYGLDAFGLMILDEPYKFYGSLGAEGTRLRNSKPEWIRIHRETGGEWLINVTPGRVPKDAWHRLLLAREAVDHVRPIADAYLGRGWGVGQYIWHYSPRSNDPQFPAHVDNFDGCKALKVYVYLTACDALNGALEYARGTHKIGKAVMAQIGGKDGDNSFENVKRLWGKPIEHPVYIPGAAGTVVLFDPAGVHGAGPVRHGERYIFRAHLVEKKYVRKHLHDQVPWRRALRRIMG